MSRKFNIGDKVEISMGGTSGNGTVIEINHDDYVTCRMDTGEIIYGVFIGYIKKKEDTDSE